MNVREWIGQPYTGRHGCLAFVQDVYKSQTGHSHNDSETFYQWLLNKTEQVDNPSQGDFVLFNSEELHVGYMINDRQFLHCYEGGASIVSDLDRPDYQSTLMGFYRIIT